MKRGEKRFIRFLNQSIGSRAGGCHESKILCVDLVSLYIFSEVVVTALPGWALGYNSDTPSPSTATGLLSLCSKRIGPRIKRITVYRPNKREV